MKIIEKDCTKCGICIKQCHLGAIKITPNGSYEIDASLCNGCSGLLDIQCARECKPACIVSSSDEPIKNVLPDIPSLRPDHLLYLIAVMGTGNSGHYTLRKERVIERSIISRAYLDPAMKVRIVPVFDSCCLGCPRRKEELHREHLIDEDIRTAKFLGFSFGEIINFWEAVNIAVEKFTPETLKNIRKSDIFVDDFMNVLSDSKKTEKKINRSFI